MWRKFIIIAIIIIIVDQVSKFFAMQYLDFAEPVPVIGNFFKFTLIKNPYGLWGMKWMFTGTPLVFILIMGISIVLIVFIFHKTGLLPLAFVFGGAVGNFIDRVRLGAVVDFLDFGIRECRWPVFNIADACITIGAFLIIITGVIEKRRVNL